MKPKASGYILYDSASFLTFISVSKVTLFARENYQYNINIIRDTEKHNFL